MFEKVADQGPHTVRIKLAIIFRKFQFAINLSSDM